MSLLPRVEGCGERVGTLLAAQAMKLLAEHVKDSDCPSPWRRAGRCRPAAGWRPCARRAFQAAAGGARQGLGPQRPLSSVRGAAGPRQRGWPTARRAGHEAVGGARHGLSPPPPPGGVPSAAGLPRESGSELVTHFAHPLAEPAKHSDRDVRWTACEAPPACGEGDCAQLAAQALKLLAELAMDSDGGVRLASCKTPPARCGRAAQSSPLIL